jgi:uncharacterized protein YlxW (UPF0749 family)
LGKKEMPSVRPKKRIEYTDRKNGVRKPYTIDKLTEKVVATLDLEDLQLVAEQTVGSNGKLSATEEKLRNRFQKMIKNRISARESRERRKRERVNLQSRVAALERSNNTLTELIVDIELAQNEDRPMPLNVLRPPVSTAFTTWHREHADLVGSIRSIESMVNNLQKEVYELRRSMAAARKQQTKRIDKLQSIAAQPLTHEEARPFYIEELFNDRFEKLAHAICLLDNKINAGREEATEREDEEDRSSTPSSPPVLPLTWDVPLFVDGDSQDLPGLLDKVGTSPSEIFWE